jgi:NAD(P)-dependent dehydrogenase (short-subunit alcohol dehydrogenase family)
MGEKLRCSRVGSGYNRGMATAQAPIGSGFGAKTTAREVLSGRELSGTLAIVTGGYAGVGLETTRALAEAGATVSVPARTIEKAKAALAGIPRVEIEALDLAEPESIDKFAQRCVANGRPVQVLINNAGIMATPLSRDARGFESQLATNHLGHFQLTARLWPLLRKANGARVVSLSYGQSKSANVLFAVALDARGKSRGVRAFAVHPGAIMTELVRSLSDEELQAIRAPIAASTYKNTEQGAATSVWCATSKQLEGMGGVYCEDVEIAQSVPADFPEPRGVRPWAIDSKLADQLWSKSEEWTGVSFGI